MFGQPVAGKLADLLADQQEGGKKAENIHQAVPADLQWAETEDDRIDFRVGDHGWLRAASPWSLTQVDLQYRDRRRSNSGNSRGLAQGNRPDSGQFFDDLVGQTGKGAVVEYPPGGAATPFS